MDTEIIHRIFRIEKTGRVYRNGKVYKAVVQLTMVCGAETWAMKKAQEKKKMDVALYYIEAVHKH